MSGITRARRARRGFTLVELMIVIFLIGILLALATAFVPRLQERNKVTQGASQLQGWLNQAKQWALRDQAPRGIRLMAPGAGSPLVSSVVFLDQPDDVRGDNFVQPGNPPAKVDMTSATTATVTPGFTVDFSGGFYGSALPASDWLVQPGDFLELNGITGLFRITAVTSSGVGAPPTADTLTFSPASSFVLALQEFRITRRARPRTGEPPVSLPQDAVIDLTTNGAYPWYSNPLPTDPVTGNMDIMFAPSGQVVGFGSNFDKIQLWVRDSSQDLPGGGAAGGNYTFNGEQALVTVFVRTGMVISSRVDPTPDPAPAAPAVARYLHPYAFTQDGLSTPP